MADITSLWANSPLLTYSPTVGTDNSTGWVNFHVASAENGYTTAAPKASVSFDFYGDQFELTGSLQPFVDGPPPSNRPPPCDFNVTINYVLQNVTDLQLAYTLPLDHYHVEVTYFCTQPGQGAWFGGPDFLESEAGGDAGGSVFVDQVQTYGAWNKEEVYQPWFKDTLTQYTSTTPGANLTYQFQGVHTRVFGTVGPNGGPYQVSIDGRQSKYSTYNPVGGDVTILFFAQELENDKTHTVTFTNQGTNLTVQAILYNGLASSS